MPLKQIGTILRRNIWVIVLGVILGGVIGFGQASSQPPSYTATSHTLFEPAGASANADDIVSARSLIGSQLATYVALAGTPLILDPVIDDLGLSATPAEISDTITAKVESTENILVVTATSTQPAAAAALADAVSESLSDRVVDLGEGTESIGAQIDAQLVSPGADSTVRSSSDLIITVLIGAATGFAIALVVAAFRAQIDTRIRTRHDVRGATHRALPVEAQIKGAPRLTTAGAADDATSEAYRRFVAELTTGGERLPSAVIVTSPAPSSGAPAAAVNIATTLAERGDSVILVDADLRGGQPSELLGLSGARGLSDVLTGDAGLPEAIDSTTLPGVRVVPAGSRLDDASALLWSKALETTFAQLRAAADVVVVSAPPVLDYADAARLAEHAETSILVVTSGDSRVPDLADAYEQLKEGGAPTKGVLLTDVPRRGVNAAWR